MPVILDPDNYDVWLDPGMTNVEAVSEMLALRRTTDEGLPGKPSYQLCRQ